MMHVPNINLEKKISYTSVRAIRRRLRKAFADPVDAPALRDAMRMIRDNLFVLSYGLIGEQSESATANGLLGAAQALRMNFWSAAYHAQRAISLPEPDTRFRTFVMTLQKRYQRKGREEPFVPLVQRASLTDLQQLCIVIEQEEGAEDFIARCLLAEKHLLLSGSVLLLALDAFDHDVFPVEMAACSLLTLCPWRARRLAAAATTRVPEEQIMCKRIIAGSYELENRTTEAAKTLTAVDMGLVRKDPQLITEAYLLSKRGLSLKQTRAYLERLYQQLVSTSKIAITLPELNHRRRFFSLMQWLGRARGIPPVLVSTISKSGSTFLQNIIFQGLVIPPLKIFTEGVEYDMELNSFTLSSFRKGGVMCRQHFFPEERFFKELSRHGVKKVIFHVRDPRQALISWAFYKETTLRRHTFPSGRLGEDRSPFIFGKMSFEEKIDYHIEHFLPRTIALIEAWLKATKSSKTMDIKITTFENMVDSKERLLQDILDFYGLRIGFLGRMSSKIFKLVLSLLGKRPTNKKRKGKKKEWHTLLTKAQIRRVKALTGKRISTLYSS